MQRLFAVWRRLTLVPQGILLLGGALMPTFAITTMFPALPSIIGHFAHDPAAIVKVPLLVSAPGLAIAICSPFAGMAIDRFGRCRLLIIAMLVYGFAGALPIVLDNINQIFAARLVLGVTEAVIITAVNTLVGDYWDAEPRRDWIFVQGLVGPLFASAAVLVAGAAARLRWNSVFLVYFIALPLALGMIRYLFEPKAAPKPGLAAPTAGPFPWARAGVICLVTVVCANLYYVFIISGSLVFAESGVTDSVALGQILALPSLFVLLGAVIFRKLAGATSGVQLGVCLGITGLGLCGLGGLHVVRAMQAGLVVQQTGIGMMILTLIAWAQSQFGFAHRGRGMGLWASSFFAGQFTSPYVVHLLSLSTGTMHGAFFAAGLTALASAGLAALLLRTRPVPVV